MVVGWVFRDGPGKRCVSTESGSDRIDGNPRGVVDREGVVLPTQT